MSNSKKCSNCGHTNKNLRCEMCGAIDGWYPFELVAVIAFISMVLFVGRFVWCNRSATGYSPLHS